MATWAHLPKGHHPDSGFTTVELPESAVRDQLESLPSMEVFELARELKFLREEALAGREANLLQVRKNQSAFTRSQQAAFKAAINKMVQEGTYASLVLVHVDMSHNMHGSMGDTGLLRFLGWHRQYLMEFENTDCGR